MKMNKKPKKRILDCCFKNIDKAVRKGRAFYLCPKCGRDISVMWYLYQEMLNNNEQPKP